MRVTAATATDVGCVRENNEDLALVEPDLALFAVADGMGGHRGGEVASRIAIEALHAAVADGHPIATAIGLANEAVFTRSIGDAELSGMGTTMTAVLAPIGRTLLVGHVGDSRGYLLHDGLLTRMTSDHSLVEELVRDGRITSEQAEHHPQRSIITRALGIEPDVDVDTYLIEVVDGDRVLLCSDGLSDMVREDDIAAVLGSGSPQAAAQALVECAIEHGGGDNVTVVVLEIDDVELADAGEELPAEAPVEPPRTDEPVVDVDTTAELPAVELATGPLEPAPAPAPPAARASWWQRLFGRGHRA